MTTDRPVTVPEEQTIRAVEGIAADLRLMQSRIPLADLTGLELQRAHQQRQAISAALKKCDSGLAALDGLLARLHTAEHERYDARELLREWLSYTGLRHRAFSPLLDASEYKSGRSLVHRTDAVLAAAPAGEETA